MTTTVSLSDLLRTPNEVIENLDKGDVVLTRRSGETLRLSKESSAERDHEMVSAFGQLITAAMLDETLAERLMKALAGPFPWVEFLPDRAAQEFAEEFLRIARACASVGRFDRLAIEVANWRETAIAYSLGLESRPAELDYITGSDVVEVADPRAS